MGNDKKHITYSLADIEQYLQGKLSPAEMHELEKAALHDPFLADAIEGYESADLLSSKKNLAEIEAGLLREEREEPKPILGLSSRNNWWKIAAAVVLFAGVGTISWYLLDNNPVKTETLQATVPGTKKDTIEQNPVTATQPVGTKQKNVSIIHDQQKQAAKILAEANVVSDSIKKNKEEEARLYAAELADMRKSQKDDQSRLAMKSPVSEQRDLAFYPPATVTASGISVMGVTTSQASITSLGNLSSITVAGSSSVGASNLYTYNNISAGNLSAQNIRGNKLTRLGDNKMNTFNGRVVDAYRQPIPNTAITIPKTNRGFVTDANGYFTFNSPDSIQRIQISSVGFATKDLIAKASLRNEIVLTPVNELNEVVVVGYGTKKSQKTLGASVAKSEPSKEISKPLLGRVSGVDVSQAREVQNNKPIQVRGAASLRNNDPLFVVDGLASYDIRNLDPNTIEKVEVLKDSAATAIYGAKASTGVVVITTKKASKKNANATDITIPDGGWKSFIKYLKKKIDLPKHATVTVTLTLKDGKVQDAEILQTFNELLNQSLIQALKEGSTWTSSLLPGETGKRNVVIVW